MSRAKQRKQDWLDSELFTESLMRDLLRADSRDLLGADGWRALKSAFECAVLERADRFEAWQAEETLELDALRAEAELLNRKLAELGVRFAPFTAPYTREGGAK